MSLIKLDNVSLSYPVLGAYTRSLKQSLLKKFCGGETTEHDKINFVEALKNINLNLKSGDRLGLIGRNGAGKSTLLKMLAGIYAPTQGSIQVNGNISPLLGISVGMHHLATGYENIKFRCLLYGFDKKKTQAIIKDIEAFTELGTFLNMPIKTYSSGMSMRLSFGIATAMIPDILIVDEVVGVGDAQFLEKAKSRLNSLIESSNILVLASHSDDIIKKFCNKILWLDHGTIVKFAHNDVSGVLSEYHESCLV
jgi:homopolymeric O-antigen transport system ATP-binding protein